MIYSEEAEMCVLGCMMLSPTAAKTALKELTSTDFFVRAHQWYFDIFAEADAEGVVVDMVVMKARLMAKGLYEQTGGTPSLLLRAESVVSTENLPSYIEIVKDKALRRNIDEFGHQVLDSLVNPHFETKDAIRVVTEGAKNVEATANANARKAIPFVYADKIVAKPQNFLVSNYVPENAITLLSAEGESGKTTLLSHWIACLSAGIPFPGRPIAEPMNCWWISNEDSPESRIKPSLIAHGGDPATVAVTSGWFEGFTPKGIKDCDQFIGDMRIKFCYFDPLWEFVAKAVQAGGAQTDIAVRTAMNGMAQVLHRHGCTMVGAGHVAKATAQSRKAGLTNASSAIPYGSVEMFNVARSALTLVQVENDTSSKIVSLAHIKCNVGKQSKPISFEILSDKIDIDGHEISLGRLAWLHGADHRAKPWDIVKSLFYSLPTDSRVHRDVIVNALKGAGYGKETIKDTMNRPELMREGHEFWLDPYLELN